MYLYSDEIKPLTVAKDMLVRGLCDFDFDNTNQQTISESMKNFKNTYNARKSRSQLSLQAFLMMMATSVQAVICLVPVRLLRAHLIQAQEPLQQRSDK